ncbi:hypothetical protein chiPu_0032860, partial [Chiloscyllium punctatum]|nr:hypothetical protein [Chiloscyllium punctatum]
MMEGDCAEMQHDQCEQHIGEEDVASLIGIRRRLVRRGDLGNVEQAEEARIVLRTGSGMRPAQHRHQDGDGIECAVVDPGGDPLPGGHVGRQRRRRIDSAPHQPEHREQQHQIADVGMDRPVEELV